MARIDTLKIYEAMKDNWTRDPSRAVVEAIEESLEEYHNGQKDVLATKADLKDLESAIVTKIIMWMVGLWIVQLGATIGIIALLLKR